ncbi:hypothetical protein [Ensifer sp. ENS12]|uniref:hypothetical protein n=1 Tax=Ensifer sp. ENS12 TaxID=2854774 RepID=UPI001C4756EF|nr:hypothetical protein [Ensifer sp. ENS12]MBV7522334.1 hypothetical protein [Ensifer sp. ENS12]
MRRTIASLLGLCFAAFPATGWTECDCGDDYCIGGARYEAALKEKKARLAGEGYAPELVALLEKADACYAAVSTAPDGFSIMTVTPNTAILVFEWTKDNARIAAEQIADGTLSRYFVFNARKALSCCGTSRAEDRPDWDADLALNKDQAIECTGNGGSACK